MVENLAYGRLKEPWFPLNRTDLDVLKIGEGTCGEYAQVFYSCMTALGKQARFAHVIRDCFGDDQDHFCGAFYDEDCDAWVLVDPTISYRLVDGFDLRHEKIEWQDLASYTEEIARWEWKYITGAREQGIAALSIAGLRYAPWLYEQILDEDRGRYRSVFLLYTGNVGQPWSGYAMLSENTRSVSTGLIRLTFLDFEDETLGWDRCIDSARGKWDESRWDSRGSPAFGIDENLDRLLVWWKIVCAEGGALHRLKRELKKIVSSTA